MVKQKRNVSSKRMHKKYLANIERFFRNDDVIVLDSSFSSKRIIQKCDASISFPFTSTAISAKFYSKPSVFYDPINLIQKNDRASHGIKVISNYDTLRKWLNELYMKN